MINGIVMAIAIYVEGRNIAVNHVKLVNEQKQFACIK